MKRWRLPGWTLFCLCGGFLRGAQALTLELHNISDDSLFSSMNFEKIPLDTMTATAKQYLRLDYPEILQRQVHIYSNNNDWKGAPSADRSGLVLSGTLNRNLPLFWSAFAATQPGGVPFNGSAGAPWKQLTDRNNPGFSLQDAGNLVPLEPGKTTFIYLSMKLSTSAPAGEYKTNLIVEVTSDGPGKDPALSKPACSKIPLVNPVLLNASVDSDFQVRGATVFYRAQGESTFTALGMSVAQNTGNPFQWNLQAQIPKDQLKLGAYEFYYEADDGFARALLGNSSAPVSMAFIDEFAPVEGVASSGGGELDDSLCPSGAAPAPDLVFPPGSLNQDLAITIRKISPSQVPPDADGRPSVAAFDFQPQGQKFLAPVTLSFSFQDADHDGIVDGTNLPVSDLRIFWFDGFDWRWMGGKVDLATNKVTTNITHFSVYAVFPAGPLTADLVRPKERIITPNGDGKNDFAQFGISDDFEISIFDAQGRRVRRLQGINTWDGRMDDGNPAPSGVYIYQVRSPQINQTVSGTIGVAR